MFVFIVHVFPPLIASSSSCLHDHPCTDLLPACSLSDVFAPWTEYLCTEPIFHVKTITLLYPVSCCAIESQLLLWLPWSRYNRTYLRLLVCARNCLMYSTEKDAICAAWEAVNSSSSSSSEIVCNTLLVLTLLCVFLPPLFSVYVFTARPVPSQMSSFCSLTLLCFLLHV